MPEVAKISATSIDLWPKPTAQREEISRGVEQVQQLLEKHDVRLGGIARYRPGAFKLNLSLRLRTARRCENRLGHNGSGRLHALWQAFDAAIKRFSVSLVLQSNKPSQEQASLHLETTPTRC